MTPTPNEPPSAATPPPDTEAGSSPALVETPLVAVARADASLRLFPLRGALLVGQQTISETAIFPSYEFSIVQGTTLEKLPRMTFDTGLAVVTNIVGDWPDRVYMTSIGTTGRTGIAQLDQLTQAGWQRRGGDMGSLYAGVAFVGPKVVGVKSPIMFGEAAFESIDPPGVAPYKLSPPGPNCDPQDTFRPRAEVVPTIFGATKAGDLLSLGWSCEGTAAVEVWPSGSAQGKVLDLGNVELDSRGSDTDGVVVQGPGNEAYLIAGKVVHYKDGDAKVLADAPSAWDGALTADGRLWLLGEGQLFVQTGDGFVTVPMPHGSPAEDVAADEHGTLWVSAGGVLFREKLGDGAAEGVVIDVKPGTPAVPKAFRVPRAGGPFCSSNVVVLYGFTKITPDDYDFPLTRSALKGHTEFSDVRFAVTRDLGQKFLTGQTPDFATAKKLMDHIQKKVQGARPTIVCAHPEVVREFPLDLATGELRSP